MNDREIEVKVLDIDVEKTVSKLKRLGAKKVKDVIYKRIILDSDDNRLDEEDAWLRIRTDGKKNTLTYKKVINNEIDGKEEIEVQVEDYDKTLKILEKIGFRALRQQESRRVRYGLDGVEIDIDLWPMIPPHIEIEAKTKEKVLDTIKRLEIKKENIKTYTGRELYKHYSIELDDFEDLRLEQEKKDRVIE
ncbi:class IV adenylate cyclase [Candidatus Woesearchaeota archaeon]|nr:class IV adenylate cyclase [Candidatus Woesearchaeota archaeon]